MEFYVDKNIQVQIKRDRLWINTPYGCLLRIQGLDQGNVFVNTGINPNGGRMIDIKIFPKQPPPPPGGRRMRAFFGGGGRKNWVRIGAK